MKSRRTKTFRALYDTLPDSVKRQADAAYRLFRNNPFHPSLQFKQVGVSTPAIYSARVGNSWRVLGKREGDTITWFWIGSHEAYNKLVWRSRHEDMRHGNESKRARGEGTSDTAGDRRASLR